MAKKLRIIFMILALGVFVIPNQPLLAQKVETSCCADGKKKDCCNQENKKDTPCHDDSDNGNCGDQCNSCGTCHYFALFYGLNNAPQNENSSSKIQVNREKFDYRTPEFSDIYSNIWQPPKIG